MSNLTLEILNERIDERKLMLQEQVPGRIYPCNVDYLNLDERAVYYRLQEEINKGVVGSEMLRIGVYSQDDLVEHQQLVAKIANDLNVCVSLLRNFHLDVLRGMRGLQTGSWLCT